MQYDVLGPLRVRRGGEHVAVAGRLRLQLLGLLLAHRDEPLSADWLVDALWGDGEPRAGHRLHLLVHKLRKALGEAERIEFAHGAYRLTAAPDEVDAERFEHLVAEASRRDDPEERVRLLREGLALWRGLPYDELDLLQLAGERHRLEERRFEAWEQLCRAQLALGRHAELVSELTVLIRQHPLRESLHLYLMTALHRSGRRADALAAYQQARRVLVDELGLEPGEQLRRAEQRVLSGEEPLDVGADAPRPAQLPPAPVGFVGREPALAELDDVACTSGAVVVTGTAGVGKTALVTEWAHRARERFPDGQLYVDLRGFGPDSPLTPADVLAGFLRALGVEPRDIPQELGGRETRWRSETDGRRLLVVLDNAATVEQVRPLLLGTSPGLVVVTSRDRLEGLVAREGARRVGLDRLSADEARNLLGQRLGIELDDAAATRVVDRCARLPLAIRIAAERLRSHETADAVVDDLDDGSLRLDLFDTGDVQSSVRSVLSWSYQQLPDDAAALFRCFGLRPGPDVDAYELTALLGNDDLRATRRLVDTVVRAHLAEPAPRSRYHQHDLLWAFAAELTDEVDAAAEDRVAAVRRLRELYLYCVSAAVRALYQDGAGRRPPKERPAMPVPDLSSASAAEMWLDDHYRNLLVAADVTDDDMGYAAELAAILDRHLRRRGLHADALSLHTRALCSARERGDRTNEQAALFGLGHVHRMTGRYDDATGHYRQALALARDLGSRYGEMSALGGLADNYFLVGHMPEADRHYRLMLAVAREEGFRLGELKAYAGLGHSASARSGAVAARVCFTHARRIARELGNLSAELTATAGLGDVERMVGDHRTAEELYSAALEGSRACGHRVGESICLERLAELGVVGGRLEAAEDHYREAMVISREVGNRFMEVFVLIGLARIARRRGRLDEAARHLSNARPIAEDLGQAVARFEVQHGLGRLACATGDADAALGRHREALAIATGATRPRDQARSHEGIAAAYQALGESGRARDHWQRAVGLYAAHGLPEADEAREHLAALGS